MATAVCSPEEAGHSELPPFLPRSQRPTATSRSTRGRHFGSSYQKAARKDVQSKQSIHFLSTPGRHWRRAKHSFLKWVPESTTDAAASSRTSLQREISAFQGKRQKRVE